MKAIFYTETDTVALLLARGANIEATQNVRFSPLFLYFNRFLPDNSSHPL
jgi:hypothetical protein